MSNREILLQIEALANEKNVSKEVVFNALEYGIAYAAKKQCDEKSDIVAHIDRQTGDTTVIRRYLVVADEDLNELAAQLTLDEAKERDPDLEIGDYFEEKLDSSFGRIGAQTGKQVILQRIRDAEREQILNDFLKKGKKIVKGTIKRLDRNNAIVEFEKIEALLPRDHMIPRENWRVGDSIRAFLIEPNPEKLWTGGRLNLRLSRTLPEFLVELFTLEVPEIQEKVIEVRSAARDPGIRAKIAVKANDSRVDPIGTCIGPHGSRVKAVTNELKGERVDIVLWSNDPAQFVINALAPAEISSIIIDEDKHSMDVVVTEDQLAPSIGRNGQNVRLASELTGWELNIITVEEAHKRNEVEFAAIHQLFVEKLSIDDELADKLVHAGFCSIEEFAYIPISEMLELGLTEEVAHDLRNRARNKLLSEALADQEEQNSQQEVSSELAKLDGITEDILQKLDEKDIKQIQEIAELAVDELMELIDINEDNAKRMILAARAICYAA